MSECWINSDEHIELPGYEALIFPRKTGKGGGIVIFYKNTQFLKVKLLENISDSIIWLKLTTGEHNKDQYFAFCYIAPEGSVFYNKNDLDLFQCLEDSCSSYKTLGDVFVAGDFNARCGNREDYISQDFIDNELANHIRPLIHYSSDNEAIKRKSTDNIVNQFGRKLINLCKTTSLRIVNGRIKDDENGSITFCGPNGVSLIDYLLCEPKNFNLIKEFSSGIFNIFSDHAPITFALSVDRILNVTLNNSSMRCPCTNVTWNDENDMYVKDIVANNIEKLFENIVGNERSDIEVNNCVNDFTQKLDNLVMPFCNVSISSLNSDQTTRNPKRSNSEQKPWFNKTCKVKLKEYKTALCNFNKEKSRENYSAFMRKKSDYKKYAVKQKRMFERYEGNRMDYMRKTNPRQFYKYFSRRKSKGTNSNITHEEFMKHFENLTSLSYDESEIDINFIQDAIYSQLDIPITVKEIIEAIKKLNKNKSCAEDHMINEIFITCKDDLSPILCKLFNIVLDSGIFPEAWSKGCISPIYKKGNENDPNNYRGITKRVQLKIIFLKIGEINTIGEQFHADVYIQARWREPKLDNCQHLTDLNLSEYWNPLLIIQNLVDHTKRKKWQELSFNSRGHAFIVECRRIKGHFSETLELAEFPFDHQSLNVVVTSELSQEKLQIVEDDEDISSINVSCFVDEQEWSLFDLVECISTVTTKQFSPKRNIRFPCLQLGCYAARRSGFFVWNVILIMAFISTSCFTTFAVKPSLPQNRLQLSITLMLTTKVFKLIVINNLPKISYNTRLKRVQLKIIFLKIGEINTIGEQFHADVYIQARWREPKLDNCQHLTDLNLSEYWNPLLIIQNLVDHTKRKKWQELSFNSRGHAFIVECRRIKGHFSETLELAEFPFDHQSLNVVVTSELSQEKLQIVEDDEDISSINVSCFVDEQEWSLFDLVECISTVTTKQFSPKRNIRFPCLQLGCYAARRSGFFVWNVILIMAFISTSCFTTFAVKPSLPQNRLQLSITLMLTTKVFKLIVINNLPKISYNTRLVS
ncbi:hypothetical protein FSP39_014419 [Pinctada imbricata]|uniref:Neurotransmitter-gated ion-channel ligand-binding domain-containing protein n=1 Tax=Pinctada imbricata TaxID=66713 RepID=A0AA88XKT5_PINIB|nr:hypothetical protein FSP39_014419 [Pinctada imbricata]